MEHWSQFNLSDKLETFLSKVEGDTNRRIMFDFRLNSSMPGVPFSFKPDPSYIVMVVTPNTDIEAPDCENPIAHEATHGYLTYALGYCIPSAEKPPSSADVAANVSIVFSMVDDIVVNYVIQKEGFDPFYISYLEMVGEEVDAARKRDSSIYQLPGYNKSLKSRFMVLRYIVAWGYVRFCYLSPTSKKLLEKFLAKFSKAFCEEYEMASQVKNTIIRNDIFTAEGNKKTIEAILKLWNLDDYVELSCYL